MCGVAGMIVAPGRPAVSLETLRSMIAMLGHRGPDGYGLYRDERVGLAHRRLSIIDLDHGAQPLTGCDEAVWLSFNGEIFNYVELRRDLVARGHRFRTDGDSEVIIHLFEEHGTRAWAMLNGQFAIALWDRRREELHLVRDAFGILPMHFAEVDGGIVFGSEIKALLASGLVDAELDPEALVETFTRWSAAAPRTSFVGVRAVRPGEALTIDASLRIRAQRHWALDYDDHDDGTRTIDDAADELGERLDAAVRIRLRADVPVGAYLSGGLDSSVICSLIAGDEHAQLETYAVRFADPAFDETAAQHRMADVLGTDHHEILCDDDDISRALPAVVWHCEAPLLRTGPVPLFLLSGLVRSEHMKVVLTGEGADELFSGYGIFKEQKVRRFWAQHPDELWRASLLGRAHTEVLAGDARGSDAWSAFFGKRLTETDNPSYSHLIRWANTNWSLRALDASVRERAEPEAFLEMATEELPPAFGTWDALSQAQWLEIQTFMSPYLLQFQGDRVAMAHGIEVRYPFLDPAVITFAAQLPPRLRMPMLRDKLALRRFASGRLPAEIAQAPKVPYRAPMTRPFVRSSEAAAMVDDVLSPESCARFGLVDGSVAQRLVTRVRKAGDRGVGEREEMAFIGVLTLQLLAYATRDQLGSRVRAARAELDDAPLHVLVDRVSTPTT